MSCPATWQSVLTSPAPGRHIVQLYVEPGFLARATGQFIAAGFRQGEAALVIATPLNWRAIARRLETDGFRPDDLERRGQLTVIDAAESLAHVMVDGMPDGERFRSLLGGVLETMRARGYPAIRAFGEMVDLLRRSSLDATIRLEELWNELLAAQGISLLCSYSLDTFDPQTYRGLLQRVSATHSDLIPAEDYWRLERAVERAYVDVFGASGDAQTLRRTLTASYVPPAEMPESQAAILALHDLVPGATRLLLDRVSHHYRFHP